MPREAGRSPGPLAARTNGRGAERASAFRALRSFAKDVRSALRRSSAAPRGRPGGVDASAWLLVLASSPRLTGRLPSGKPKLRIRRPHPRFLQTEFPANQIGALDQRHALVKRDPAGQSLAAKAAIGADHQLLLGDVFQRLPYQRRNVLRRLNHRVAVVDNADADLLVGPDVLEQMQILSVRTRAFESQYITVELQQVRQSAFVTRHFPMDALLIRITPASMHPDLGIHVDELAIERLGEELEIGIRAIWLLGAHMMRRFLHLDERAAGSRHVAPRS